ncbi:MAG: VWA domain-containing protein [Prevotellaceae bacterium]|nr:VWA domain-containing protein [Prevotellaceae bacterium]
MNIKYFLVLYPCMLYACTVFCQEIIIPSNCGLFSPHQVVMEDYLKVDAYSSNEFPDINLEIINSPNKKNLDIELLMDISSPDSKIERKPLNLCFALDRSASMKENSRMEKLKGAMKEILSFLTPDDYVSIVTYDDVAGVVLPAGRYNPENDSIFRATIDRITIGGGTNMLAGMLRGYDEIKKNWSMSYRNRLILMSDGVSTTGEKNPDRILNHTVDFYAKGIETSTIGIGNNINFNLLHDISVEGRGKSHFIGDCDSAYIDIGYVLREEFYNMNAAMEDIRIEISHPKYLKINDVYGALKVSQDNDKLVILCSNLSQTNQYILAKFQSKRRYKKDRLTVSMSFTEDGERKRIERQITYTDNSVSEKILLANKIIDAVNCVKNKLVNQRYKLDCLDRFVTEPSVPDNIVFLKELMSDNSTK